MKTLFLYPSDYFDPKKVEQDFLDEYEAMHHFPECKALLFNYDAFVSEGAAQFHPHFQDTGACIYRGWMLKPEQYGLLHKTLAEHGIQLVNSPAEYEACHLFPNAYPAIEKYTPKAVWFPGRDAIDWNLVNSTFGQFMLKDYVKSVKDTDFPKSFSTPVDEAQMQPVLERFLELRGNLYTGGFLFKEFVALKRYAGATNEYRAFFLDGNLLSISRNSNQKDTCPCPPPDFVERFRGLSSRFYTVDFAECSDGRWIVIETGDGQVSGLSPGQYIFKFYEEINRVLQN